MQKEGTAELGVTLSMVPAKGTVNALVNSYNNITWSIVTPPSSPLQNMAEITAGANLF